MHSVAVDQAKKRSSEEANNVTTITTTATTATNHLQELEELGFEWRLRSVAASRTGNNADASPSPSAAAGSSKAPKIGLEYSEQGDPNAVSFEALITALSIYKEVSPTPRPSPFTPHRPPDPFRTPSHAPSHCSFGHAFHTTQLLILSVPPSLLNRSTIT